MRFSLIGLLVLAACSGPATTSDTTTDASASDAGHPDASASDAGDRDAAVPDAGQPDASVSDAGTLDAGSPDAGAPDASTSDAGASDAGTQDAGGLDATTADAAADAGETDAGNADAGGFGPGDAAWASFDPTTQQALSDQLANGVANNNLVGAAMGLASAEGTLWTGATGLANVETMQPWVPERSFRIGSVTKTFTAALIFLLEADGALTLDDPLEQWVPGYYDGLGVTLRHLMTNTSGIVSYNYVGSFDSAAIWTPTALVQWAVDHEPALHFAPGSQWEYSNTNWVLLGLVIEAAGADTYEALVAQRLTLPLGLTHTYIAGADDNNPAIVECYAADGVTNMTQAANPSFGWAAGAAVSTPADLARWAIALYGSDFLPAGALARMVTPTVLTNGTVTDYGMGAFLEIDGEDALYGHTGGYAAYFTYMYYWKRDRLALVVMSNTYQTNLRDLSAYGWSVPLAFPYP